MGCLSSVDRWVRDVNPSIPESPPLGTSLVGAWVLSPEQHVLESLVYDGVAVVVLMWLSRQSQWKRHAQAVQQSAGKVSPWDPATSVLLVLLSVSFLCTVVYKYARGSVLFLLQPCHVLTMAEIVLLAWPRPRQMDSLFDFVLHWQWSAILALAQPDLRDYGMIGEVENFFVQHILMLFVPAFLIHSRRFTIRKGTAYSVLFVQATSTLYHFVFLESVNILFGVNINYLMCPPPGIRFLGRFYRLVVTFFCLVMTTVTRFVLVEGELILNNILFDDVAKKRKRK